MDYGKMIKLLLPNNKFINIQISGDENELKDLLSTVIDVSPNQIKGIKDSEGNYFTLSSAIKNFNILQINDNIYYELILGKDKKNETQNNLSLSTDDKNSRNNFFLNNSPKVGNYYANYYINGKKMYSLPENNNNFSNSYSNINNNTLNNINKPFNNNNLNTLYNKTFNNTSINFNSFNNLKFKDENFYKPNLSFEEIRKISQQDLQLFSSYLLKFLESKLINEEMLFDLNKMMTENNEELYKQFLKFKQGIITREIFLQNLISIYQKIESTKIEKSISKKKVIKNITDTENEKEYREKIYEKMKEYFQGENLNIIRLMLKYENESIMEAINDFKINEDINFLIEAFQKSIVRYKKKSIIQTPKFPLNILTNNLKQNKDIDFPRSKERHNTSPQGIIENELTNNKKLIEIKKKRYHSKKTIKRISTHIQKLLENKNKIIFDFILNHDKDEYQSFRNIYIQNIKSNNLGKELNDQCQRYVDKEIRNYGKRNHIQISNFNIDILNKLLIENNFDILKAYNNFNKHNSINELCKELLFIINNFKYNVNSDRYNYSSDDENENENDNEESNESENNSNDDTNNNNNENLKHNKEGKLIDNFINNLNKLQIRKKEIENIIMLINSKNSKIYKIINEYKKTKNILLYGEKIKDLLKENTNLSFLTTLKRKDSPKKAFKNILISKRTFENKKPFSKKNTFFKTANSEKVFKAFNDNLIKTFEKYISELSLPNSKKILLKKKLTSKSNILKSIFEDYHNNKITKNKFEEKINLFLKKEYIKEESKKKSKIIKQKDETPEALKESKDKLYWFIHPEVVKSKNILNKQKEIILLLYREFCIDKNTYDIINKKIEGDDKGLISAFEVYAVTKDHNEFIETLRLISDLNENYKGHFYHLINLSNFSFSHKDKLINLYNERNESLFKILKNYDENEDKENALSEMKYLIHKKK